VSDNDEDGGKWHYISEMWVGLCIFLLVVIWIVITYLNAGRAASLHRAEVNACSHSTDVTACIKAVK
jgi:hypothetical protein